MPSQNVKMPKCQDAKMPRCQDAKMSRCQDVKMPRCQDVKMPRCQDVKMPRCQNAKSNCQIVIKMSNQNDFKPNLNPNCVCIFFLRFVCGCLFSFKHSTITEYVVRYLSCPEFKDVIEHIVQLRSRVQAAGNLVFTQAILLACDGPMPKEMVSQAFIGACMRSVCVRSCPEPKTVSFKHKTCEPYLQKAQHEVISRMSNFDDDTGLKETLNQAAREYHTVLKNGVWMNFTKWQTKFVIAALSNTELPP